MRYQLDPASPHRFLSNTSVNCRTYIVLAARMRLMKILQDCRAYFEIELH